MQKIRDVGKESRGFVVYYAEVVLRSTNKKVFLDFVESNRNSYQDADLVSSNFTDQPLKQVRITNDGSADFIRIGFNRGSSGPPYIKIKFGETVTIPFVDTEDELVLDMVVQANTSNTTVRVIGL